MFLNSNTQTPLYVSCERQKPLTTFYIFWTSKHHERTKYILLNSAALQRYIITGTAQVKPVTQRVTSMTARLKGSLEQPWEESGIGPVHLIHKVSEPHGPVTTGGGLQPRGQNVSLL